LAELKLELNDLVFIVGWFYGYIVAVSFIGGGNTAENHRPVATH